MAVNSEQKYSIHPLIAGDKFIFSFLDKHGGIGK
jgi:hypothetical protein